MRDIYLFLPIWYLNDFKFAFYLFMIYVNIIDACYLFKKNNHINHVIDEKYEKY